MLRRTFAYTVFAIAGLTMTGCASTQKSPHLDDPFEGLNRATFKFNKTVDDVVIKPVSYVYLKYLPQPFQIGIGNFFDNIREVTNVANDVLQLKFAYAAHDLSRLLINTTVGIGGLFDPASSLGLEHRKEDFGQTLYHWGYHHSYYIVLPFIGPSTFRDTIGLAVDYYALSIWPWIEPGWEKYSLLGLDYLDLRARLLRRESVLDALAVDEYTFMRDAYFQHRKYLFDESPTDSASDIYEGIDPEDFQLSAPKTQTALTTTTTEETTTTTTTEPAATETTPDAQGNGADKSSATEKTDKAAQAAQEKAAKEELEKKAALDKKTEEHVKKIQALETKIDELEKKMDLKKDKEIIQEAVIEEGIQLQPQPQPQPQLPVKQEKTTFKAWKAIFFR